MTDVVNYLYSTVSDLIDVTLTERLSHVLESVGIFSSFSKLGKSLEKSENKVLESI